jgi:hypothetical protein
MPLPDVSQFERDLNMERVTFSARRRDLAAALRPFNPPEHALDRIVSYAEEFGAEEAARKLVDEPAFFELRANANDTALIALKANIEAVHASHQAMDHIVSTRENLLAQADPKRERVYVSFGREFTIDMPNRRIRYLDTGKTEALVMEDVAPRPEPAKNKQQDRKR